MRAFLLAMMVACVASAALAAGDAPKPSGPVFMPIDRLSVPLIRNGQVSETVTLLLRVEVPDAEAAKRVKDAMPRLADGLLRELFVLASLPRAEAEGLDLARAKPRLLATAQRLFGAETVRDLLIERTLSRRPS
jgi:hypothetical protein